MPIDDQTRIIGSIAMKRSRFGPLMHNAAYKHLGTNFVYVSFPVAGPSGQRSSELKAAVAGMVALKFIGFAVSMPHKQAILRLLDKIDPVARAIGAVNTVANNNGRLTGYNSDWIGAMNALEAAGELNRKRVLLLGAGGAARAIAYGLKQRKCDVMICNRSKSKARRLAREFGHRGGGLDDAGREEYDILINATSVGFGTEESILPAELLRPGSTVMDIVFDRADTPLLKLAKARKCRVIPGYKMLLHQAVFQFELFTGQKAPVGVMERVLARNA